MAEKLSEYIIPIGILVFGYSILSNLGLISKIGEKPAAISTNISPECPRGQKYNTEIWRDCDPGYVGERTSWLPFSPQSCICQGRIPGRTDQNPPVPTTPITPLDPSWWDKLFAPTAPETVPSTPMPLANPAVWSQYHPTPFVQDTGRFQPIAGQTLTGIAGLDYLQQGLTPGDFSTPAPSIPSGGSGGGGDATYSSPTGQSLTQAQAQAAGIID